MEKSKVGATNHQDTKTPRFTKFNLKHHEFEPVPDELNIIGKKIVDAAYTVHKNLGRVVSINQLLKCWRFLVAPIAIGATRNDL